MVAPPRSASRDHRRRQRGGVGDGQLDRRAPRRAFAGGRSAGSHSSAVEDVVVSPRRSALSRRTIECFVASARRRATRRSCERFWPSWGKVATPTSRPARDEPAPIPRRGGASTRRRHGVRAEPVGLGQQEVELVLVDVGEHVGVARRLQELIGHLGGAAGWRRRVAGRRAAPSWRWRSAGRAGAPCRFRAPRRRRSRRTSRRSRLGSLMRRAAGAIALAEQRERRRRLGGEQPEQPVDGGPGPRRRARGGPGRAATWPAAELRAARAARRAAGARARTSSTSISIAERRGAVEARARRGARELGRPLADREVHGRAGRAGRLDQHLGELPRRGASRFEASASSATRAIQPAARA